MKPCPCGKTPEKILVEGEDRSKWARCYGDCCGEWMIEYRNSYEHIPSDESQQLAEQAWNDAVRPAPPEPMRDEQPKIEARLTLTGTEISDLVMMLGFSPLVFDEENDQHEQELTILKYDGEHIAYFTEYPEEGQITLG